MPILNAELNDVLKPVSTARGLPNAHYTDPQVFDIEREKVMFNNWAGIGFGKDIPEAGDAMPIDLWDNFCSLCAKSLAKSMCFIMSADTVA